MLHFYGKGCRNTLNETEVPVMIYCENKDLLSKNSRETIVEARAAHSLVEVAFDLNPLVMMDIQTYSPSIVWKVMQGVYAPKTKMEKRRMKREFEAVRMKHDKDSLLCA